MRMLVTGREGQVVRSLIERGSAGGMDITALGRPDLDLSGEEDSIVAAIGAVRPEVIVSAAAYTLVDKAESEAELAYAVNERGPAAIARAARELKVPLIHLSTDYVFDGKSDRPYIEEDSTNPDSVYGMSKLAGERAVLAGHADSVILRTAWVYSPFGSNFVKTMLRLAKGRDEIGVVSDQHGNPTSALDIADGILTVARQLAGDTRPGLRGVFHMTGSGEASWAEFAEAIFAQSDVSCGTTAKVRDIRTQDYPTVARRPLNSRLNSDKLAQVHGVRLPDWQSSLKAVIDRLYQEC